MNRSQPYERVTQGNIKYSINEEENTASVAGCQSNTTKIIIPRAIEHKSKEYIVTTISNGVFRYSYINSVEFASNSELRTIGKNAFSYSKLASIEIPSHVTQICDGAFDNCKQLARVEFAPNSELRTIGRGAFASSKLASIKIPASVVELKDGWCYGTDELHHVEVEAGNAVYASVDGKCIIGKSDIRNEDYDTLVLFALDTVEATIPGTIKIIGSYAFACAKLASIEIPSHVAQIGDDAFFDCRQLARVEFAPNSELRTIGRGAFASSKLASIKIPASVAELKDGWCYGTDELYHVEVEAGNAVYASVGGKYIIGKSDIRNEDYDTLVFLARDTVEATIPGTIKIIGSHAFSRTKLASIEIPSHVTQICEGAFCYCEQLARVEFAPNSELRTIGKSAFLSSALASIEIPSHVTQIGEGAFIYCEQLQVVEIEGNSVDESTYKDRFRKSKIVMLPARNRLH